MASGGGGPPGGAARFGGEATSIESSRSTDMKDHQLLFEDKLECEGPADHT